MLSLVLLRSVYEYFACQNTERHFLAFRQKQLGWRGPASLPDARYWMEFLILIEGASRIIDQHLSILLINIRQNPVTLSQSTL